ncbi:hypothetical protein [Deinococcus budaensis]|uniref:Uncharacterized protein n=1 Tax=Deinococcus budaensis TaxID=1665626 RepID=A0A7W8GEF5_9DEIO|nr:hypothetical protein [Deinococcus budaensis]MBB5234045.1 hypothetical protein [Deinococcus budaensis]
MTTLLGMVVGAMLVGLGILVRLTRAQLGEAASALRPDDRLGD